MDEILDRISKIGIVPVVKITNPEHTIPLTQALYKGGIDVAETLLSQRICNRSNS